MLPDQSVLIAKGSEHASWASTQGTNNGQKLDIRILIASPNKTKSLIRL